MATALWDTEGILLIGDKDDGVTITGEDYSSLLKQVKGSVKEKRRGKRPKEVLLLHNNVPVHKSNVAWATPHDCGFQTLNHPPSRPGQALPENDLLPNMKIQLRTKKFMDDEEGKAAIPASLYFEGKTKTFLFESINTLIERSERCIN